MPPVTRSASRPESQTGNPEKTTTKTQSNLTSKPKSKPKSKQTPKPESSARAGVCKQRKPASPSLSPNLRPETIDTTQTQPPIPYPILELISIDVPSNLSAADRESQKDELTAILRAMYTQRRESNCIAIHTGHSHPAMNTDHVVIEWAFGIGRQKFLDLEASKPFRAYLDNLQTEHNRNRRVSTKLIRKPSNLQTIHTHFDMPWHFEIWTAYFPTSLPDEDLLYLQRIQGPLFWDLDSGEEDRRPEAMRGLCRQFHGWVEGEEVEFRGQSARRMVYVFKWESEAAEERYKRELRSDGSEVLLQGLDRNRFAWEGRWEDHLAFEVFVGFLEECGMLGFEIEYARFRKVYCINF
ncbi:hypothetical protein BDW69DRAFT_179244 [Aspergillus filifer]